MYYIFEVVDDEGVKLPYYGIVKEESASERLKESAVDTVEELPPIPLGLDGPLRIIKNENDEWDWEQVDQQ